MENISREDNFISEGLSHEQVSELIAEGKINGDNSTKTKSVKQIVSEKVLTFFNLINVILAALVLFTGSYKNMLFFGVAIFSTAIGIFQEIRAKRVIDKLSLISSPKALVIRGGERKEINVSEILLGDLILFAAGNQICVDCLVLEGECEVNESLITGESDPVTKKLGDELLSGSFIISGSVKAKAIRVGSDGFAAKITAGAKYIKKNNSVMLRSLDRIIKVMSICIVPIAIGLFINSVFFSEQPNDRAIVSTVAAVVGMIPEGLYLLSSVVMAVSSIRLASHNALAQDMYCVETLARVDTLCLDKTGTLTEGSMKVTGVSLLEENFPLDKAMNAFAFNMSDLNPTVCAVRERWSGESESAVKTVPFSSEKKWSGAEFESGSVIFGAPEFVLKDGGAYEKIRAKCEKAQSDGTRVLLVAYSRGKFREKDLPESVVPAALVFIGDIIRKEAPDTLKYFEEQGVDIKIISGDNPVTVSKIAERAGVKDAGNFVDASALSSGEIPEAVKKYSVFGRVLPEQKLEIVKALKADGHTVGMTGDGANDVLALKEADCSIAMQSGSDAARSVSSLVLLDSNFASMPRVVAEGRRSVNNLQRSGALYLTKTVYSVILALAFIFMPIVYPFQPIQITLLGATAIGIPSFFLALEPNCEIIKGSFIRNIMKKALPQGLAIAFSVVSAAWIAHIMNFSIYKMSTFVLHSLALVSFMALFRTMAPLKPWKIGMLIVLAAAFMGGTLIFTDLLSLQRPDELRLLIPFTANFLCSAGIMLLLGKYADRIIDLFIKARQLFRRKKNV